MTAAVSCVREIFPDATIQTTRRRPQEDLGVSNPSVVISVDDRSSAAKYGRRRSSASTISTLASDVLWEAKQKNLYEKNPKKRRRSIKDIRKSLAAFRELLEADDDASGDDGDNDVPKDRPPLTIGGSCNLGADNQEAQERKRALGPPHS
jgi:hypothetical protein